LSNTNKSATVTKVEKKLRSKQGPEQVVESTADITKNTAASAVALAMADGAANLPVTWFSLSGLSTLVSACTKY
jgi:hypothetical protein